MDPSTGDGQAWTPNTPEPPGCKTLTKQAFKSAWVAYARVYNVVQAR